MLGDWLFQAWLVFFDLQIISIINYNYVIVIIIIIIIIIIMIIN